MDRLDDAGRMREECRGDQARSEMPNNVRKLRVAFLLTPSELARLMRADASDVERIEAPDFVLTGEWIAAVAHALGVPAAAVTAPDIDANALRRAATAAAPSAAAFCPVGARYALLAIVAKFGGVKFAGGIDEDDLARAVQNMVAFIEDDPQIPGNDGLSRLTLALRIAVLAILQSRGFVPGPGFEAHLEEALQAATRLISGFAAIDDEGAAQ